MAREDSRIAREDVIDNYDFSFVHEKLQSDGSFVGEDANRIENEFKRFMKLVLSEDRPLAMIDRRVDEFWHTLILFTPQYDHFCKEAMGFFVHHQPRTSKTPVPEGAIGNFVDAYQRKFGHLDSFWCERLEPELRDYVLSGSIPESLTFKWSGWTGKRGEL